MIHRPLKGTHFSRYTMGFVFLSCGFLLTMVNLLAGSLFLLLALVILYYAPRWNLKIETHENCILFSENVVETVAVKIFLNEVVEIRRVSEKETRKGFLTTYPEYHPFIEFEMRSGKIYRMHDIFDLKLDEELERWGSAEGVVLSRFPREGDDESDEPQATAELQNKSEPI